MCVCESVLVKVLLDTKCLVAWCRKLNYFLRVICTLDSGLNSILNFAKGNFFL